MNNLIRSSRVSFVALLAGVSLLLGSSTASAESQDAWAVRLSPGKSKVRFEVDATAHTIQGKIPVAAGNLAISEDLKRATGEVTLVAGKANTGNARRDKKMHREVLRSATFPTIRFAITGISGLEAMKGTQNVTLKGTLELGKKKRPISVRTRIVFSGQRFRATGKFNVAYEKWGVPNVSTFLLRVGNKAKITLQLRGTVKQR